MTFTFVSSKTTISIFLCQLHRQQARTITTNASGQAHCYIAWTKRAVRTDLQCPHSLAAEISNMDQLKKLASKIGSIASASPPRRFDTPSPSLSRSRDLLSMRSRLSVEVQGRIQLHQQYRTALARFTFACVVTPTRRPLVIIGNRREPRFKKWVPGDSAQRLRENGRPACNRGAKVVALTSPFQLRRKIPRLKH